MFLGIAVCTDDIVYSVTIVTNPSKGPFHFEQTVQFSCLVEPTPPEPVTYQYGRELWWIHL